VTPYGIATCARRLDREIRSTGAVPFFAAYERAELTAGLSLRCHLKFICEHQLHAQQTRTARVTHDRWEKFSMKRLLFAVAMGAAVSANAADFGQKVEALAKSQTLSLYGTAGTLTASSSTSLSKAAAEANPAGLLTVAPGLSVRVVSANAGTAANIDQMVLWPNDTNPTHIIACNEQDGTKVAVQRINLATGVAEDILVAGTAADPGMNTCDPVRKTPWGTIIVGEETDTGRVFEILDPLTTTGVSIHGSLGTTTTSDPSKVVYRPALGSLAFEGLAVLPNGVIYMTDENRPGNGNVAGAMFKFIPTNLWTAGAPITDLASSPFSSGRIFGFRAGRNSSNTDFGQGNEFGRGVWVEVTGVAPIGLRAAANSLKLTGYYRPEDAELDATALAAGNVRFCGTNTGQDVPATSSNGDNHFGEVYCFRDGTIAAAGTIITTTQTTAGNTYTINTASVPEYQPLVIGNVDFAMMDNIARSPLKGFFVLNEDGEGPTYATARNNDIWACLDDGADADNLSDACVKLMTLNDLTAESTGGVFDGTGKRYFVSIQHNITGHGVVLEVTGWQ
jgi:hypothetical protein